MHRAVLISCLALLGIPSQAQAADITVQIAGYQYSPSGWLTLDPLGLTGGAGTMRAPTGTSHDAPVLQRNDSISFENLDRLPHNVTRMDGPACSEDEVCDWTPVALSGGGSGSLTLTSTQERPFALGTYVYLCTIHRGMRGEFTVSG